MELVSSLKISCECVTKVNLKTSQTKFQHTNTEGHSITVINKVSLESNGNLVVLAV